jgi:hypothetical protein
MPLPDSWVDALFAKLSLRYGAAFMRQWPDAEPALIKADWADVLSGYDAPDRRNAITFAIASLPPDRPPNALQFLSLCRQYSGPEKQLRIEHNPAPANPDRVRSIMARLRSGLGDSRKTPAQQCAANIIAIARKRGALSAAQKHQLDAMLERGLVTVEEVAL